jgi:lactate permease
MIASVVAAAASATIWPQPLAPVHSVAVSALVAAAPLAVVLLLMGVLRRSGLLAAACGLASAGLLAIGVWGMPLHLAGLSVAFATVYALWSILWLVFCALWLYNVAVATGSFDRLRDWMARHASGDACIQAMLVAFCFGALIEGSAGFGAPVAITAFLLVRLGFEARKAVVVALLGNTAPVAFGALGVPIVALAGVTGLPLDRLSAMVGRQLPFLSLLLPAYLAWVVGGLHGLRRSAPAALVAGASFAAVQFLVSNYWGPYATDVVSSLVSIAALSLWVRAVGPAVGAASAAIRIGPEGPPTAAMQIAPEGERILAINPRLGAPLLAWLPWLALSAVMIFWSYARWFERGQVKVAIPRLDQGVLVTLYDKPYAAVFNWQPLSGGTAVLAATLIAAAFLRVRPRTLLACGATSLRQLRVPGITVLLIVGLAYLFNYSGMAYTLGAAVARAGHVFPVLSSYLGWLACFLSGSDTAANLLFGNLQVAAAHQLGLDPVLLAATNSSGAVAGKMISPQNIAIGVTTVGLIGQEGRIMQSAFWHSVLLAGLIGVIAYAQAYYLPWMLG